LEWAVPYLPIDPKDVGRSYDAVIRINSQSGKGGIAYLMETDYGVEMPRRLQIEFSKVVQQRADTGGAELSTNDIWSAFDVEYLSQKGRFSFKEYRTSPDTHASEIRNLTATIMDKGSDVVLEGKGTGPIDAFVQAINAHSGENIRVVDYHEHAIGRGADTKAIAYLEIEGDDREPLFGVGMDKNITEASLKAVVSAINRSIK
jgi:2-isopropylmalate synthase